MGVILPKGKAKYRSFSRAPYPEKKCVQKKLKRYHPHGEFFCSDTTLSTFKGISSLSPSSSQAAVFLAAFADFSIPTRVVLL